MARLVPEFRDGLDRYALYLGGFLFFAIGGQTVYLYLQRDGGMVRLALMMGGTFYLFGFLFWWFAYADM